MEIVKSLFLLSGLVYLAHGACYIHYPMPQKGIPRKLLYFAFTDFKNIFVNESIEQKCATSLNCLPTASFFSF